jgi:hypothetical protein
MPIQSDELYMNWYRQQVSILCPRGYEPRALPLRHAGFYRSRLASNIIYNQKYTIKFFRHFIGDYVETNRNNTIIFNMYIYFYIITLILLINR